MLAPAALGQCCGNPKPGAATAAMTPPVVVGAAQPGVVALIAGSMAAAPAQPVNRVCPIREGEVDAESPTRTFKGVTIGFCCPGCEGKWDKKTDDERMALLVKHAPEAVTAIETAAKAKPQAAATDARPDAAAIGKSPAVMTARAYLALCEKADAAALNALFLNNGRATVSENAGDEGSWETYRDHHLLPELKEMPGFKMTVLKEDVQTFGTTSIVRQIGSFTVPDANHPDAPRKYLAAVTYVVVDDAGTPRIAHLHWSSRPERKAEAKPGMAPSPAADPSQPNGPGHEHK
ncbi:MAG: hypothetical protein HYX52_08490 [Chloroflexi bacterium]|nr:hypothetical protein [Chloroflexota bacterium]